MFRKTAVLVAVLALGLTSVPADAAYDLKAQLGPVSGSLAGAKRLAVDPGSTDRPRAVFAMTVSGGTTRIFRFAGGTDTGVLWQTLEGEAADLEVNPKDGGDVFVSFPALQRVRVFSAAGATKPDLGSPDDGDGTEEPDEHNRPQGLAYMPPGYIVVADGGFERYSFFNPLVGRSGQTLNAPGMQQPQDAEVSPGPEGHLHFADIGSLYRRYPSGTFGFEGERYTGLGGGIAIGDVRFGRAEGALFLAHPEAHAVERRPETGVGLDARFRTFGSPQDVAVLPDGTLYALTSVHLFRFESILPVAGLSGAPPALTNSRSAEFTQYTEDSEAGSAYTCTLDGVSTSCSTVKQYTSLADGNHTYTVTATDYHGTGPAATHTWRVDATPPAASITGAPPTRTKETSASFSFNSSEANSTFQCKLDGGVFAPCTTGKSYTGLAQGTHTFAVRATDQAGNVSAEVTRQWTVDTTGAVATFSSGPANATRTRTAPSYGFSSEAGATFSCRVDAGAAAACTSPRTVDLTGLADGQHTFTVTASDDLGNAGAPVSRTFVLDRAASLPGVSGPTNGIATAQNRPQWTFTHDETGTTYRCAIDTTVLQVCPSAYQPSAALTDGPHVLYVRAVDDLGNESGNRQISFSVDTTAPPAPAISAGPAAGAVTTAARPEFAFGSGGGTVQYRCSFDSLTLQVCTSPNAPAADLADGSHTFRVQALDSAGNQSAVTSRTFVVDRTAPVTSVDGPADGALTNDPTPTFTLSADEAGATFRCQVDDAAPVTCTGPFTPETLADGEHVLRFFAIDGAGNADATPEIRRLVIDTEVPDTTITQGPADGASTSETALSFAFSGGEEGATFRCSLDGADLAACTSPLVLKGLAAGKHTLVVVATDGAGNADATPAVRTFTILAPVIRPPVVQPPVIAPKVLAPLLAKSTLRFKRKAKALKIGLVCPAAATGGCIGGAVLKAGKATLGKGTFALRPGTSASMTVKLSKRARKRLARKKNTKAVLTVTPQGGLAQPLRLTLRRR